MHPGVYRRLRAAEQVANLRVCQSLPVAEKQQLLIGRTERGESLDNLLAVDVPTTLPEVAPSSAVYAFTDGTLEARTPAAKHLMRMGPENALRLQNKLRELKDTIWLQ